MRMRERKIYFANLRCKILAVAIQISHNVNANCSHLHRKLLMIKQKQRLPMSNGSDITPSKANAVNGAVIRIKSQDFFGQMREVEIDHEGRIYRLRLTQFNKLILTA